MLSFFQKLLKKTPQKSTLIDILSNSEKLPWNASLFLSGKHPFLSENSAMVIDQDKDEDPEEREKRLEEVGYRYALSISTVQEIVNNLKLQIENPTNDQLIEAFNYYFKNDAFIEIK